MAPRELIEKLRAAGCSFHAIAANLNRHGLSADGGGRWYGASVRRVLVGLPQGGAHRCTESCQNKTRPCPFNA
ncbi:MAG: helix-turn-helix domain-containing protein [Pseudomonadota bacterium]